MLIVRSLFVVQNVLQFFGAASLRGEPLFDVTGEQIYDASIVSGRSNLRWRVVCDGRKGLDLTFCRTGPFAVETGDVHRLRGTWIEMQHHILAIALDVLEERGHQHQRM